jgi:exodeoxyribonuclease V gamma subunit
MPLNVDYVGRLDDIIEPTVKYLTQRVDLFEKQHLVVPTAGVKAWLLPELAKHLGASGKQDGIVANIKVDYPGSLTKFLVPKQHGRIDPWDIEHLTFEVLAVIANNPAYSEIIGRSGGPLLAARAIADRFDRYHVRRPAMIREWEKKISVLSPTANDEVRDSERLTNSLSPDDMLQYTLWRAVREQIGEPSPPARTLPPNEELPRQLLVAGVQSLNLPQIQALQTLGDVCDVQVLLVHPSTALQQRWATTTPVTPGLAPLRSETEIPEDADSLVYAWLRGTHETQILLASQGIAPTHATPPPNPPATNLLGRLQKVITTELNAVPTTYDPADHSLTIHRCHNIGRQIEVLHDALLHAFTELPDLQPHEIIILSPDIANAAPYLQATFARKLTIDGRHVQMPLVVADRGIREVSTGAELLGNVLDLTGSRCSVDGVMAVATSPLVLDQLGVGSKTVETWQRFIERTNIRWGLTAEHRTRVGLNAGATEVHSWKLGLERMILGATLPDAIPAPALGGVVPLDDVDLSEIDDIAALIRVIDVVLDLDHLTTSDRPVGQWCDALEQALANLCGKDCSELETPLRQLGILRTAANDIPVPFEDVKVRMIDMLGAVAGHQPLRTGAITATSMVPLRGVPYRVVCVVGFDDGALSGYETEADDLIERQRIVGDHDERLEVRRALLDAMLAARDRLIITCTGTSIKNNTSLPLVTPLAEFVDFARRAGVGTNDTTKLSNIEIVHPRHTSSPANFRPDDVQPGIVWSHDPIARTAATNLGQPTPPTTTGVGTAPDMPIVELSALEQLVRDPLRLFIRDTLGINTWRDNEASTPATFPLALTTSEHRDLGEQLLQMLLNGAGLQAEAKLQHAWHMSGSLPIGVFGDQQLSELTQLAHGIVTEATEKQIPLQGGSTHDIRCMAGNFHVVGRIDGVHVDTTQIVMVSTEDDFDKLKPIAALRLLVATAHGLLVDRLVVVNRHDKWKPGELTTKGTPAPTAQIRILRLDAPIDQTEAQARLAALCDLVRTALASPCGSFGGAATATYADRNKGRETFNKFVHGRSYDYSSELIVYGADPHFDEVLVANAPELAFRTRFDSQFTVTYNRSTKEYLVS